MKSFLFRRFIAGLLILSFFCLLPSFHSEKWTFNLLQPALLLAAFLFLRGSTIKTGLKENLVMVIVFVFMVARTFTHAYFDAPSTRLITSLSGAAIFFAAAFYSAHYFFGFSGKRRIALAVLLGGGPVTLGWAAATVFGAEWSFSPDNRFGSSAASASAILAVSLLTKSLVLGFGEELFFRGVMLKDFAGVFPVSSWKKTLWLNGLFFGLWHLPSNIIVYHYDAANLAINTVLQSLNGVIFACVFILGGGSVLLAGLAHGLSDWLIQDLVSPKGLLLLSLGNISGLVFALGLLIGTIIASVWAVKITCKTINQSEGGSITG